MPTHYNTHTHGKPHVGVDKKKRTLRGAGSVNNNARSLSLSDTDFRSEHRPINASCPGNNTTTDHAHKEYVIILQTEPTRNTYLHLKILLAGYRVTSSSAPSCFYCCCAPSPPHLDLHHHHHHHHHHTPKQKKKIRHCQHEWNKKSIF